MGIEKDLEIMDNYLANRLSGAERNAFENKLEADPALRSEYTSQQSIIEGIKKARIAELKNIMNNTPVPPAVGGSALTLKVAASILVIGAIGFGVYWFANEENEIPAEVEVTENTNPIAPTPSETEIEDQQNPEPEPTEAESEVTAHKEENRKANKPKTTPKAKQPKLDVFDPTKEVDEDQAVEVVAPIIPVEKQKASSLVVETDNTQKKYNFHYQFQDGKLILLGAFDTTLYEILEFFTEDKHTIFLYYTGKYYLLDENKAKPTPLHEITDNNLLKKLDAYRAN